MEPDAAERLLAKLRAFVAQELDPEERSMFACLVAPAVAGIWDDDEVEAYGLAGLASRPVARWSAPALPDALRDALRNGLIRLEGLEP